MPKARVPDDKTLVLRYRAGDQAAWASLVQRYQRVVYAIARHAGLDETLAADVFQTVFMRLVQHLPRIAEPERLQNWICTTAQREAWLQRRRSRQLVSMTVSMSPVDADGTQARDETSQAIADSAPGPEATVEHWQQLAQVLRGLDRLGEPCRQLLHALFHDDDASYSQVAADLEMPVGSIGPTRARCLAKLRALVD